MADNIEWVPNQSGKPAILLRQAWREGKRVREQTIANLSKIRPEMVEGFRAVPKKHRDRVRAKRLVAVPRRRGPERDHRPSR